MHCLFLDNPIAGNDVGEQLNHFQKWLNSFINWFIGMIPNIITAVVILIGGWWLIKLILKIMVRALNKGKADPTVISFLNSIVKAALFIFLGVCVLSALNFDVSTLIAAIGAATVTIGLALKDSLANVASGTLIIINKKFKTGDFIETEGIIGEVIKIDMMYTTLRTYDYKEVIIPNSRLTSNNIINHFVLDVRRLEIPVPISYEEDIARARNVIMEVIKNDERVIDDRDNKVIVDKFNESSVDLTVWIWCESEDYWRLLFDMREKIKYALSKANIEIPFNQIDVHIDNGVNEKLDFMKSLPEGENKK